MYGYMGKILRVDLSESEVTEEDLPEDQVKKFLGGRGLASKYLFDEVERGVDPLGPKNKLIFMTGPLTATASPSAGRYSVVAKSPLTNLWGHSNSAGYWGSRFKRAGFDGVIIEGISSDPVYLVIEEGVAELRKAKDLWGMSVSETTEKLRDDGYQSSCIGIAGENLVRYANIMNDLHRAAGRCGMGAVMGSKRLKAIAVKGKEKVELADEDAFKEVSDDSYDLVNNSILKATLETYGTAVVMDMVNQLGGFPTRNWQTGIFPGVEKINGPKIAESILTERKACFACPISCGRVTRLEKEPYAGEEGEGPEYETLGAMGAMCDIDDLEAITKGHYLCDDYGLDTISIGSTIAFAMECFEKGILTESDTDGLEIKFGDADVMIELVHKIAKREGIGDLLAEGTKRVAEKLGRGSEKFAMNVKGLELPAYDCRAAKITGLAFATANRGGDHITAYVQGPTFTSMPFMVVEESEIIDPLSEDPKNAKVVKDMEDALTVFDAMGTCKFMGMTMDAKRWADLIASATGWDFGVEDFRKVGERIYNLERAFNVREGLARSDDEALPARLLEEPLPEGPAEGDMLDISSLLDAYYEYRGWDKKTGKPNAEKLEELGLGDVGQKI